MSAAPGTGVLPLDPGRQASACRALWLALLNYEITAALGGACPDRSQSRRPAAIQARAREWIGTEDFRTVCALAGLDADWVLDLYRRAPGIEPRAEDGRRIKAGRAHAPLADRAAA